MMIIVGATSPIGLELTKKLNQNGFNYLVLADDDLLQNASLLNEYKFWKKLLESEALSWAQHHQEEIEFIFWCKELMTEKDELLYRGLWHLAHREQIPFLAVFSKNHHLLQQDSTPFFWVILHFRGSLLADKENQSILSLKRDEKMLVTYLPDIVDIVYHFIHHRKNSGSYLIPYQYLQAGETGQSRLSKPPEKNRYPTEAQEAIDRLREAGYLF